MPPHSASRRDRERIAMRCVIGHVSVLGASTSMILNTAMSARRSERLMQSATVFCSTSIPRRTEASELAAASWWMLYLTKNNLA